MRLLLAIVLLWSGAACAAHITDQLVVGVYEHPDTTLEPLRALTSGTPVEVLQTRKNFSLIRLSDNSQGWIESRYLSEETPARAMLLALQAEKHLLKQEVEKLKQTQTAVSAPLTAFSTLQEQPATGVRLNAWHLPLLALLMLLSFIGGIIFRNYRLTKYGE